MYLCSQEADHRQGKETDLVQMYKETRDQTQIVYLGSGKGIGVNSDSLTIILRLQYKKMSW